MAGPATFETLEVVHDFLGTQQSSEFPELILKPGAFEALLADSGWLADAERFLASKTVMPAFLLGRLRVCIIRAGSAQELRKEWVRAFWGDVTEGEVSYLRSWLNDSRQAVSLGVRTTEPSSFLVARLQLHRQTEVLMLMGTSLAASGDLDSAHSFIQAGMNRLRRPHPDSATFQGTAARVSHHFGDCRRARMLAMSAVQDAVRSHHMPIQLLQQVVAGCARLFDDDLDVGEVGALQSLSEGYPDRSRALIARLTFLTHLRPDLRGTLAEDLSVPTFDECFAATSLLGEGLHRRPVLAWPLGLLHAQDDSIGAELAGQEMLLCDLPSLSTRSEEVHLLALEAWSHPVSSMPLLGSLGLERHAFAVDDSEDVRKLTGDECWQVGSTVKQAARSLHPGERYRDGERSAAPPLTGADTAGASLLFRRSIHWFSWALERGLVDRQFGVGECRSDRALVRAALLENEPDPESWRMAVRDFRGSIRSGLKQSSVMPVVASNAGCVLNGHEFIEMAEWSAHARFAIAAATVAVRDLDSASVELDSLVISCARIVCRSGVRQHAHRLVGSLSPRLRSSLGSDAQHALAAANGIFGLGVDFPSPRGTLPTSLIDDLVHSVSQAGWFTLDPALAATWLSSAVIESLDQGDAAYRLAALSVLVSGFDGVAVLEAGAADRLATTLFADQLRMAQSSARTSASAVLANWGQICVTLNQLAPTGLSKQVYEWQVEISKLEVSRLLGESLDDLLTTRDGTEPLRHSLGRVLLNSPASLVAAVDEACARGVGPELAVSQTRFDETRSLVQTVVLACLNCGIPSRLLAEILALQERSRHSNLNVFFLARTFDMVLDRAGASESIHLAAARMVESTLADAEGMEIDDLVATGHVASTLRLALGSDSLVRFAALAYNTVARVIAPPDGSEPTPQQIEICSRFCALLLNFSRRTGSVEIIDAGVATCAQILNHSSAPRGVRCEVATRFAQLLHDRADISGQEAAARDNRQAIEVAFYAERSYVGTRREYRESLLACAISLRRVGLLDSNVEMLEGSVETSLHLVELAEGTEFLGTALSCLATAHGGLYQLTADEEHARKSAECLQRGLLQSLDPDSKKAIRVVNMLSILGHVPDALDEDSKHEFIEIAHEVLHGAAPAVAYGAHSLWAPQAFDSQDWLQCVTSCRSALSAAAMLVADEAIRDVQLRRLEDVGALVSLGVRAALRLDDVGAVTEIAEAGQMLTIADGLVAARQAASPAPLEDTRVPGTGYANSVTELERIRIAPRSDIVGSAGALDALAAVAFHRSSARASLLEPTRSVRILPVGSEIVVVTANGDESHLEVLDGKVVQDLREATTAIAGSVPREASRPLAPIHFDLLLEQWIESFDGLLRSTDPRLLSDGAFVLIPQGFLGLGPVWSVAANYYRNQGMRIPAVLPSSKLVTGNDLADLGAGARLLPLSSANAPSVVTECEIIAASLELAGISAITSPSLDFQVETGGILHLGGHLHSGDSESIDDMRIVSSLDAHPISSLGLTEVLELRPERPGLVTLSTCQGGWIERRVLTEARSIAGVLLQMGWRSVIACGWPVPDLISAWTMASFYRRLASGQSAGQALLQTQDQLKSSDLRSLAIDTPSLPWPTALVRGVAGNTRLADMPSVWAAFQMLGTDLRLPVSIALT